MKRIESSKNDNFKAWISLLKPKGVKKAGKVLIAGQKTVPELLKECEPSSSGLEILLCEGDLGSLNPQLLDEHKSYSLTRELFEQLDIYGTKFPLIVTAAPELPTWSVEQECQGLEIITALGDPSNLGALIRTSYGLGVSKIVLLSESANPFHQKTIRSSSGTVLKAPIYIGPSLTELKDLISQEKSSAELIQLDMNGENIYDFKWPKNCRLLMGEEGPGLPDISGKKISIPLANDLESLNAVAASSIAIYAHSSFNNQ